MGNDSGEGEILADGPKLHDDIRLVSMAVKKRWPIPDELKTELVKRLANIVSDNPDDEMAIKAINALKGMESQNQKDEQTAVLQSGRNKFLEVAERLGLGKNPERISANGTSGDPQTIEGRVSRE